jgi:MFS family permease
VTEGQVSALEQAAPAAGTVAPRLSRPFVAALMLANFGANVALIAPIQNVLPRMVEAAAGTGGKALALGLVTGLGAFAALIANPVAGHYSDRWVSADNRTVTILIGLVTGGAAHVILGYQHSVVSIAIWWTICQATINIAYSPMSAIVVDHVDRRSWGLVWGLVSVAQAMGLIIGLAAVVYVFPSATAGMTAISVGYVVCLIPLLLVLYRLPRVRYESPGPASSGQGSSDAAAAATPPRLGVRALLSLERGFGLVWAGKFLITLAETVALLYLYYYVQDVVRYRDPGQGQLILVLTATLAAIVATVAVGRVADLSGGYRLRARRGRQLDRGGGMRIRARGRLRGLPVGQPGAVHGGAAQPGGRGTRPGHHQHRVRGPPGHRRAHRRTRRGGRGRLPWPVRLRRPARGRRRRGVLPRPAHRRCRAVRGPCLGAC